MNLRKCFAAVAFILATVTPGFACSCISPTPAKGFAPEDWVLMDQAKAKAPTPVTSGRVEGQTRDFLGAAVPKAIVVFRKGDFTREAISDESGAYQIDLPAGVYEVTVEKFNIFNAYRRKKVKVQNGRLKKFDVVLKYDVKKYPPVTLQSRIDNTMGERDRDGGAKLT